MGAGDVFVDTAGFLALWDAGDKHHAAATGLHAELTRKRRRFLTTDYVADETVTLLVVRHSHGAAADFLETVAQSEVLRVEWVGPDRFHAAAGFFRRHADKAWSFTDCVSFVVMQELSIRDCLTTDRHFQQAGFNRMLRS
jgi:predicted nucleic acid-binding protein